MTKSQSGQAFNTASGQNAGYNANANSTYAAATGDIGDYKSALGKYAAENPFVQGGEFQTAQNQALADTAGAQAQSAGQALQAEQVRSGQNPSAAIAATEQMNQNNTRNQMQAQAQANQQRIGEEAGYNQNVLNATAVPESMEERLLSTETGAANSSLGQENEAAKTPSFWQELGQGVINAGGQFAGGAAKGMFGCWIAARLYGGWGERRTVLVRLWLNHVFGKRWYGVPAMALYRLVGEWIAEGLMPRSKLVTRAMEWLFGHASAHAETWLATAEGGRMWALYWKLYENRLRYDRRRPGANWHDWATRRVGDGFAEVL